MTAKKHTTFVQLDLAFPEPEEWRPVVGWEGLYEVSSLGRVRSLDRIFVNRSGARMRSNGRIVRLKACGYKGRRRRVMLYAEGKKFQRFVHHLVLEAFVGPRPQGYTANHLDGDPGRNWASNLEWVTLKENHLHAQAMGLWTQRGEASTRAIYSTEEVLLIRRLHKGGMGPTSIAQQLSRNLLTIKSIVYRNTWAHLPEEE
jgi:hypothetical protein